MVGSLSGGHGERPGRLVNLLYKLHTCMTNLVAREQPPAEKASGESGPAGWAASIDRADI